MLRSVRVALVGYGLAGKVFHAPLIMATEGLELTSVVSSDQGKVHADLPNSVGVCGFADVLQDSSIELVVIATPDHLHAEQALAALDAGKHVVIDKPFAPNIADARIVAARAAETGRIVTIFHNRRWDADFLTLKRLIEEGVLGEIVQYESHFDRYRAQVLDRWKDKREGGVWQDLGPHLVDQVLRLFGMPVSVFADIGNQKQHGTAPDYAHVLLRYPTLRVILHISQSLHAHGLRFAVHGTKGSYIKAGLDPQEDQSASGMKPGDPAWGLDIHPGRLISVEPTGITNEKNIESDRGNYLAFYEGVRDAIVRGENSPVSLAEALDVMAVIEAGRRSALEKKELCLQDLQSSAGQ